MSWLWKYRIRLYVRQSIWLFPVLSIPVGLVVVRLVNRLERAYGWEMDISLETGRAIMGMVAGSMFSLVVLVCSAVLLAVQLASGQLTPRIIALIYQNPFRKVALALFVFTFTFSVGVLARLETSVPWLSGYLAAYGFLVNLALFLFFVDSVGKGIRPSYVLRLIALKGRGIVRTVYPLRLNEMPTVPPEPFKNITDEPGRIVFSTGDGAVLSFDLKGLVALAGKANCLIELVPQVGDYVAPGDPLFLIHGGGNSLSDEVLRNSVALGQERTMEQDPMFALRVMVDIASRALSPAVNDPTTAVLAIDQIHHLLRDIGTRYLAEGMEPDASGKARLVFRTPNWEDFLLLAVTEIRLYGRDSIQVIRRLRAMLENLIETLPEKRLPLLKKELSLLDVSAKRTFPDIEDQTLAEKSDLQGMGGNYRGGDEERRLPATKSQPNVAGLVSNESTSA